MSDTKKPGASEGCTLAVSTRRVSPVQLDVTYLFHNGSPQNAYLFNRLYQEVSRERVFLTNRDLVYVEALGADVILSKKIFPVPETLDVERPNVPAATKVEAGADLEETFTILLPLRPFDPYRRRPQEVLSAPPVERRAFVEIGFFLPKPEGEALANQVETTEGTAHHFYPFPIRAQLLLRAGPLPDALPILLPK